MTFAVRSYYLGRGIGCRGAVFNLKSFVSVRLVAFPLEAEYGFDGSVSCFERDGECKRLVIGLAAGDHVNVMGDLGPR